MTNSRVFTTSFQPRGNEEQFLKNSVKHIPDAVQTALCSEMRHHLEDCDKAYKELTATSSRPKL